MLVTNARLADGRHRDLRVDGERIAEIESTLDEHPDETIIDADGKRLLPGMVDSHVHFREPGFPEKETWASGSRAAAAGGVTTVVDQPNTDPPTVDGVTFDEKTTHAADSYVDFGINGGVTPDWDATELFERPLFALGEVFLADSTGKMGIEEDLFANAARKAGEHGVPVTVHAEDADRFDPDARERTDADAWSAYRTPAAERAAIEQATEIGAKTDTRLHIAHTSTPEGIDAARDGGMTCEVTPHHLLLSRADLADLGTFGRMNPPLRSEQRRKGVFERVADGKVQIVATDHAPHTREEKDAGIWDAPSGVPGVETALPLLLEEVRQGRLGFERVRDLTAANPAEIFDLPRKGRIEVGRDADLVLVDPDSPREIRGEDRHSKAGWTPFEGRQGIFPKWTMVRGTVIYKRTADGDRFGEAVGENVRSSK